jgi:hypothetical protein
MYYTEYNNYTIFVALSICSITYFIKKVIDKIYIYKNNKLSESNLSEIVNHDNLSEIVNHDNLSEIVNHDNLSVTTEDSFDINSLSDNESEYIIPQ